MAGKGKGGRPSLYRPEFCKRLKDHLAEGFSFESFAPSAGVGDDTLDEWVKRYPEFAAAKKAGLKLGRKTLEEIGKDGMRGRIQGFNAATWIFWMKNRYGWRDKQPEEVAEEAEAVANRVIARIHALSD